MTAVRLLPSKNVPAVSALSRLFAESSCAYLNPLLYLGNDSESATVLLLILLQSIYKLLANDKGRYPSAIYVSKSVLTS